MFYRQNIFFHRLISSYFHYKYTPQAIYISDPCTSIRYFPRILNIYTLILSYPNTLWTTQTDSCPSLVLTFIHNGCQCSNCYLSQLAMHSLIYTYTKHATTQHTSFLPNHRTQTIDPKY